ncbi:hypothetical protein JCM8547_003328 [Rhodosporidiobolus lusitaniae]
MSDHQTTGKIHAMAVAVSCFAAFGGFLYGYDTGYISGVKEMDAWLAIFGKAVVGDDGTTTYELTSGTSSIVTSILSVGTCIGALLAYPVGEKLGRRWGIELYLILFFIGVACQTGAKSLAGFAVGRVFAGLGVGGTSCLVPLYQAECSPRSVRGALVAAYQWMITIGILIAAVVVNGTKDMGSAASYQWPIALQFIWGAILAVGLLFLPESPRWLLTKGREEQARHSLCRIFSAQPDSLEINEEMAEINANIAAERALGEPSFFDAFRGGPGKNGLRTFTGCALQALQQLTGINFIFYYGTTFFQNSGISDPFLITIATDVVNVGATVPGLWMVDKFGRRPLLLGGAAGMFIAQFIVAAIGDSVSTDNLAGQKALVAFVCIFIAFFAATWGPLAWTVTSEIYSPSLRSKCMALSTASNWLLNFAIGYATPYLVDKAPGSAGLQTNVFWIWGGCCVLCFIFTYFFIMETRQLSLEQCDILYRQGVPPRKSNAFRKQILAENIHDSDLNPKATMGEKDEKEHIEA